jgi:hypothetical protein
VRWHTEPGRHRVHTRHHGDLQRPAPRACRRWRRTSEGPLATIELNHLVRRLPRADRVHLIGLAEAVPLVGK